ncbi:galactose oxidase-like domain-containing protein [Roseobacter sp. EG26]|uniref:galactose oxidase-like domain-containing protein n=1 Tax=Roseobacter sp. EG26 TaxID=3412477 RepID=UPI003CE52CEF
MSWDQVLESEIVAIHAALVPGRPEGEIIYFEGFFGNEAGRSYLYDCGNPGVTEQSFQSTDNLPVGDRNLFCAGHAQLHDGRVLVAGGWAVPTSDIVAEHDHNHGGTGIRDSFTYMPRAGEWRRAAFMHPQPGSDLRGGGRWYPTLVTLGNGEVLAVGGHPLAGPADLADNYPTPGDRRHSNNIPERYSPGGDNWIELLAERTAPDQVLDEYDRLHLAPTGHVFFSTLAKAHGDTRLFDPYSGEFASSGYGSHLDNAYDDANCSARTTSIILPILHGDANNFWIMVCGDVQPERLNLRASDGPEWLTAGARQAFNSDPTPPIREHLLGILLPTGQVFVSNGMRPDNTGVQSPEIYTPAIDWNTGQYTDGEGTWQTLNGNADQATVPRGYHSTALLQPDGSVWTAGSTHTGADLTDPDGATRETRIEVFRPSYGGNRPTIDAAPDTITYNEQFTIRMATGANMQRVVLMRCGSFTHAFDGDQRYLTLSFVQNGDTLTARAPSSSNLAPPGNYMLFVLRNGNTPCRQAQFIRLSHQEAYAVLQISTYSQLAVKALRPPYSDTNEAVFAEGIDFIYQGFLPHELNVPAEEPDVSWQFSGGGNVPGMRIELNRAEFEIDPLSNPDFAQRYRYIYDVIFDNENAYDTFGDDETRNVQVTARLNGRRIDVQLTLMKRANPFMKDGDPAWLSTDLRIHKARVGDVNGAGGPEAYVQGLLQAFEDSGQSDDTDNHPFDQLDPSQDANPVVMTVPQNEDGTYNFAIARVRFLSIPGEDADDVKVFFRLFNTVGTALEYNTSGTYRTLQGPAGRIPGLGKQGLPITSIPFFAAPRVTPGEEMSEQDDNAVNRQTLPGEGPNMVFRYYGCWLDVNTVNAHFPRYPKDDGPFDDFNIFDMVLEGGPARPMIQHIAGYHQCLVAEIQYGDDPIQPGQSPFTSDNLAQRNLATVPAANPGLDEITRTAQTSIDVKPSDVPTELALDPQPQVASSAYVRRRPDELVFSRNNLPIGSKAELYLPDVDIDDVIALTARRQGPAQLERVDDHTIRFELGEASYVALPGGRDLNIAGLLSVTLPLGITDGDLYRLSVKQYSGRTLRWVGAFDLTIPVGKGPDLLDGEAEKLSVLKYVFDGMPEKDRWYPVFKRYLFEIGERVRGFGGDPESVHPSPHGTGDPYDPDGNPHEDDDEKGIDMECACGKICKVEYDCFGDFEAFVVIDCEGKHCRICAKKDAENMVREAWRYRTTVTAHYRVSKDHNACVNETCPWSGKPVSDAATTTFEGHKVGFCSTRHRDKFTKAVAAARDRGSSAQVQLNTECPISGQRVQRDAVVSLSKGSVGFCSRAHAEKMQRAVDYFKEVARYLGTDTGERPVQSGAGHGQHGEADGDGHDHGAAPHRQTASKQKEPPSINRADPWSGKPVSIDALTRFEGHIVGFERAEDRDLFDRVVTLAARNAEARRNPNAKCPWSEHPASTAHSAQLQNGTVAFCSDAHRAEFQSAVDNLRHAGKNQSKAHKYLVRLALHC